MRVSHRFTDNKTWELTVSGSMAGAKVAHPLLDNVRRISVRLDKDNYPTNWRAEVQCVLGGARRTFRGTMLTLLCELACAMLCVDTNNTVGQDT